MFCVEPSPLSTSIINSHSLGVSEVKVSPWHQGAIPLPLFPPSQTVSTMISRRGQSGISRGTIREGRWNGSEADVPGHSPILSVRVPQATRKFVCKNLLQIWSSAARHLSPCFVLFFLREHPIALPSPLIQNHTYCSFFTECLLWLVEQN